MRTKKYEIVNLVLIIILAILLACIAALSFAAYNNQAFQRGVLRSHDSEDMRFSSNILNTYIQSSSGDTKNYETVLYPYVKGIEETARLEIPIKIANHSINNDNLVSESDIKFDLKIELKNHDSGTKYYLNNEEIIDGKIAINDITLVGRKAKQLQYILHFSGKDLDKLTIVAEAIPNTGNKILAAYICPCTDSIVNLFSYQGVFTKENIGDPGDHHGFNYEMSISSGRAEVTLWWDKNVFAIDKYFLEKLGNRKDEKLKIKGQAYILNSEDNTLTFIMDQVLGEDDYVTIFYPNISLADKDWNFVNNAVTFTATEIDSGM